jgi:hypothetical protein
MVLNLNTHVEIITEEYKTMNNLSPSEEIMINKLKIISGDFKAGFEIYLNVNSTQIRVIKNALV